MPEKKLSFRDLHPDVSAHREAIARQRMPLSLLLDHITDRRNLGAAFRLADAANLSGIYGWETGPAGQDEKLKRVSRATYSHVPFTALPDMEAVAELKQTSRLIALEITNRSRPYYQLDWRADQPLVLILSNEQRGVSPALLELAESAIHVPMLGMNSSMNVIMSAAVAVYGLLHSAGLLPAP